MTPFSLITILAITYSFLWPKAHAINSSQIVSPKELKFIEERIEQELQSTSLTEDKKFLINILAGREFYLYRFYDKAEVYYQNALKIKTRENKTEAYTNLISIAINNKNKERVKILYDEARTYYQTNPSYHSQDVVYYLNSLANYLEDKNAKKVDGFHAMFLAQEHLITLLKNKEYDKAMSAINPEGIKNASSNFNITVYDGLNVLKNKKNVKELYCSKDYKKYPKAYTYSTILCGLLTDYLKTGNFTDKKVKLADKYFSQENPEKMYLLDMVKEIRK